MASSVVLLRTCQAFFNGTSEHLLPNMWQPKQVLLSQNNLSITLTTWVLCPKPNRTALLTLHQLTPMSRPCVEEFPASLISCEHVGKKKKSSVTGH